MRVAIEDILKVYDQQALDKIILTKKAELGIPKHLDVVKHTPFVSLNNIGSAVSPSQTLWRKKSQYINVRKDATVLGQRFIQTLDSAVKGIGATALPKQKEHWSAVTTMKLKWIDLGSEVLHERQNIHQLLLK